ncbi:MAG: hypothetical protein DHS20C18_56330 [Saprospiraceae bacterium]|nr:MAG: hypothetical protein DHS20C18_56330 [Saprospiraceae bacterium]
MGQVATLFLVDEYEIDSIEESRIEEFDSTEVLYVGKNWESITYLLSNGKLWKEPFEQIFMPKKAINLSPDKNDFGPFVRYHDELDVAVISSAIEMLTEQDLRARISLEEMNKKVIYPISDEGVDDLINDSIKLIDFFKRARDNSGQIIASIG